MPSRTFPAQARRLSLKPSQRGQGMTEYIIIVALIAVAAIAVYQFFGQTIRSQTAGIAKEVAGQSATTAIQGAQTAGHQRRGRGQQEEGPGGLRERQRPLIRGSPCCV